MSARRVHGRLTYNGNGTFTISRAGSIPATSANVGIVSNTWYYLEVDYNVHDSTGSWEVRLNEVAIIGPNVRARHPQRRHGRHRPPRAHLRLGAWPTSSTTSTTPDGGAFQATAGSSRGCRRARARSSNGRHRRARTMPRWSTTARPTMTRTTSPTPRLGTATRTPTRTWESLGACERCRSG